MLLKAIVIILGLVLLFPIGIVYGEIKDDIQTLPVKATSYVHAGPCSTVKSTLWTNTYEGGYNSLGHATRFLDKSSPSYNKDVENLSNAYGDTTDSIIEAREKLGECHINYGELDIESNRLVEDVISFRQYGKIDVSGSVHSCGTGEDAKLELKAFGSDLDVIDRNNFNLEQTKVALESNPNLIENFNSAHRCVDEIYGPGTADATYSLSDKTVEMISKVDPTSLSQPHPIPEYGLAPIGVAVAGLLGCIVLAKYFKTSFGTTK